MKWDGTVANQSNRGMWDQARLGRFTASVIHKLMSGPRSPTVAQKEVLAAGGVVFGDDAISLIAQVAGERITNTPPFPATSASMEWGLTTEEEAYDHLCDHWRPMEHAVFAPYGEFGGATPDAITDNGKMTVDIKCPYGSGMFVKWAIAGDGEEALYKFSKEYYWQIMMQAKCYGVERCALVYYDPRLPDTATKYIAREYTMLKEVSDRIDVVLEAAEVECLKMMEAMADALRPVIA